MKKAIVLGLTLGLALLMSQSGQAQSGIFNEAAFGFDMRRMNTDFSGYSLRYRANTTDTSSLLNFRNGSRQRDFLPMLVISDQTVFAEHFLVHLEYGLNFSRDLNRNFTLGLGYRQGLGQRLVLRLIAAYNYHDYGMKVHEVNQREVANFSFAGSTFRARRVEIFMGNRQQSVRGQLGLAFAITEGLQVGLDGYYNFIFDQQARVTARSRTFWPRRRHLAADDALLDILDQNNNPINNWNTFDRWGLRLSLIFRKAE